MEKERNLNYWTIRKFSLYLCGYGNDTSQIYQQR